MSAAQKHAADLTYSPPISEDLEDIVAAIEAAEALWDNVRGNIAAITNGAPAFGPVGALDWTLGRLYTEARQALAKAERDRL